jgi:hypothetical protein
VLGEQVVDCLDQQILRRLLFCTASSLNCLAASGSTWAAMNWRPSLPVFVSSFARLRVFAFAGKRLCFWRFATDLSSRYFHVPLCVGLGLGHLDLDVIPQPGHEAEQPIDRKSIEAAPQQVGNLGLPNSQQLGSFGLGKTPSLDDAENLSGKLGLRHIFLSIVNPEVSEYVAAAIVHSDVVGHGLLPFCSFASDWRAVLNAQSSTWAAPVAVSAHQRR